MPTAHRQDPTTLVHDLTRRLAEEFDSVPIPAVTSAVNAAVSATALFGESVADSLATIEQIAREDLAAVLAVTVEQTQVAAAG